MNSVLDSKGPVMKVVKGKRGEKRLVVGYMRRSTKSFFSAFSDVFHYYGLNTVRKHVDQFSNGVTIMSFYLTFSEKSNATQKKDLDLVMPLIVEEGSLLYNLPKNALISFVQNGSLSVTESIYGNVGWIFAQHFLKRLGSEYTHLAGIVDMNNLVHVEALTNIKKRLRSDTFTREV